MTIPKKLYYIWIGNNKKPEILEKCLLSWEKNMPDYEIIEINENNFDLKDHLNQNKFLRECYKRKLWAYVSDYIRVHYLYEHGGIYLDTDMEIVKNITEIINKNEIHFFSGFESDNGIGMGLFGTVAKHEVLKEMIKFYDDTIWESPLFTMPQIIKYILINKFNIDVTKNEIEDLKNNICIFRKEYFYPFLPNDIFTDKTITENTYAIHWWHHSWKGHRPFLFLKTKNLNGLEKIVKTIGIYLQIIRDVIRSK